MDPFAVDGGCLLVHFFPKLLKFLQSEPAIVIFASCMTVSTTSSDQTEQLSDCSYGQK